LLGALDVVLVSITISPNFRFSRKLELYQAHVKKSKISVCW
jgi:hypothetical protein